MKVNLLHNTPLWVCSTAIRKCWASEEKSDIEEEGWTEDEEGHVYISNKKIIGSKDKELIDRVGNKNKHSSTLEHLNYTFDIDGISRALLQELVRHRHASYSVKSSRYTLKELKNEEPFVEYNYNGEMKGISIYNRQRSTSFLVNIGEENVLSSNIYALDNLRILLSNGLSNDKAKYCLPEAYKTSLVMTINARSLQNLLQLRTSPSALKEFQLLANELFNNLPEEHKYLFEDNLYKRKLNEN